MPCPLINDPYVGTLGNLGRWKDPHISLEIAQNAARSRQTPLINDPYVGTLEDLGRSRWTLINDPYVGTLGNLGRWA